MKLFKEHFVILVHIISESSKAMNFYYYKLRYLSSNKFEKKNMLKLYFLLINPKFSNNTIAIVAG